MAIAHRDAWSLWTRQNRQITSNLWLSNGAPVSVHPLAFGAPAPFGGLRRCLLESHVRSNCGVGSVHSPGEARLQRAPGPLDSWWSDPRISRFSQPNRFSFPVVECGQGRLEAVRDLGDAMIDA